MRNKIPYGRERRKSERLATSAALRIVPIDGVDPDLNLSRSAPAKALNLSCNGILFTTDQELDVGSLVKTLIHIDDIPDFKRTDENDRGPDLVTVGEVKRISKVRDVGFEVAVDFVAVEEGDLEALKRLIGG